MATAIEIDQLTVRRGSRAVLENLSLELESGSVIGLLGPSGSGKSTLMRAICGVQVTHGGSVTVLGSPAGSAEARTRVGYVTQAASVYEDLTARENLHFFGRLYGLPASRVQQTLDEVELGAEADRPVGNLSGGQRSRVSLAAALLADPAVLVLDEPTVGLDPALRVRLWDFFHQRARAGACLLVSSHVMDEAERCDRLLLIHEGGIIADDTPDAIRTSTGQPDLERAFLHLTSPDAKIGASA